MCCEDLERELLSSFTMRYDDQTESVQVLPRRRCGCFRSRRLLILISTTCFRTLFAVLSTGFEHADEPWTLF